MIQPNNQKNKALSDLILHVKNELTQSQVDIDIDQLTAYIVTRIN